MHINWIHLALTAIVVIGLLLFFSNRIINFFIFYPQSRFDSLPPSWGLQYEDIFFKSGDGIELHGWFFPGRNGLPIILFCHGNAGNISHCLPVVEQMNERNLSVFIFDYRGYGKSKGSPYETGIYKDGLAAYDQIIKSKGIPPEDVVPFGHSLGATVAIEIALKREVRALILESAFTSLKDMAKTIFVFRPFAPLLGPNYNNVEKIRHITKPKLIIHGEQDEIVPFQLGKKLFDASGQPKFFLPLAGAGHNDVHLIGGERYADIIAAFAKDLRVP
ncbi:alpha/beta hydrolase [Thermodesulfobacteriota bacterium]